MWFNNASGEIARLYQRSNAHAFEISPEEFNEILTEVILRSLPSGGRAAERARVVDTLHVEELMLARACARGNEFAWQRFVGLYGDKLHAAALGIAHDECVARELADSLYAELFGTRSDERQERVSKLNFYLGRGSLEGWLRTVLAQQYVDRIRAGKRFKSLDESEHPGLSAADLLPERDRSMIDQAVDAALATLTGPERFLLASYYLDGRTLNEIGAILRVHEATVSRHLDKLLRGLRKRTVGWLRGRGMSKATAEQMLALDVRDLSVDVRSRLLQERQA